MRPDEVGAKAAAAQGQSGEMWMSELDVLEPWNDIEMHTGPL
jgi:hypothetical protein